GRDRAFLFRWARRVAVAGAERGDTLLLTIELVAPDTRGVIAQQVDGYGRFVGDRGHLMDVTGGRDECVELSGIGGELLLDLKERVPLVTAVVNTPVDRFGLPAPIDSDESPGKVVMDWR